MLSCTGLCFVSFIYFVVLTRNDILETTRLFICRKCTARRVDVYSYVYTYVRTPFFVEFGLLLYSLALYSVLILRHAIIRGIICRVVVVLP